MLMNARVGPLFTDLYELTMAASYYEHRIFADATFSLFVRGPATQRGFYVSAGLESVMRELESYRFSQDELDYLKSTGLFSDEFLSYLKIHRFSGSVFAMPEGTICFPDEPILEITAPIIEAQLLETFVLNTIGFQTLIASKAARCVHVAGDRTLIDFSLRRTQGQDAGVQVARSTYLTGFAATSNVLAGKLYGIPISGTMAHSFITAFDNEYDAFCAYAETFPRNSIFLIDTYDTLEGAHAAVKVAQMMAQRGGGSLVGVRLDSGDMASLSRQVRTIFDNAGLHNVKIFASSGFDEFKIAAVIAEGAAIDGFGVGTKVGVSADEPYLDIVYKMVHFDGRNVRKLSPGKVTLAGKKQVFRRTDPQGCYIEDTIGLRDEALQGARPILEPVMEGGKILGPLPTLPVLQHGFKENFRRLDSKYKGLQIPPAYPVRLSRRLRKLQDRAQAG
jgi:nicotinate phosphoribosyltransferase